MYNQLLTPYTTPESPFKFPKPPRHQSPIHPNKLMFNDTIYKSSNKFLIGSVETTTILRSGKLKEKTTSILIIELSNIKFTILINPINTQFELRQAGKETPNYDPNHSREKKAPVMLRAMRPITNSKS
jgi:hypothetical protein